MPVSEGDEMKHASSYQKAARYEKATKIAAAIRAAVEAGHVTDAQVVRIREWKPPTFDMLARVANVNKPSAHTRELVRRMIEGVDPEKGHVFELPEVAS